MRQKKMFFELTIYLKYSSSKMITNFKKYLKYFFEIIKTIIMLAK